jgi:MFS family permease
MRCSCCPLEREYGWTRYQLTSVYSVFLLVSGFAAPLIGILFDRIGPRLVYSAGIACIGGAYLAASSLDQLWQFYLLIGATVGVGVAMTGMVPASAMLSRWFHARLSRAIGIAFSATGSGSSCSYRSRRPWWTAMAGGAPTTSWASPCWGSPRWCCSRCPGAASPPAGRPSARASCRPRAPNGRCAGRWARASTGAWCRRFFFTAVGMFAIFVQLVAFLVDAGFSALTAATAFGICGMLSAGSVMGSGFLTERFGSRQTVS